MSDEVSESMRISMVIIFAAALITSVLITSINASAILNVNLDKANSTKGYVSATNILNLQNKTRTATDLYKIYSTYEESINSVAGYIRDKDGNRVFKVFYLRSGPEVNKEAYVVNTEEGVTTYDKVIDEAKAVTTTGHLCNINRMDSELLTDYGFDSFAKLQCYVTRTNSHNGYDIYFNDLRE